MKKVVNLHTPNVNALSLLERVANRIKSGESAAIALVEIRRGRNVATAWSQSSEGEHHLLLSGAARLMHRLAE